MSTNPLNSNSSPTLSPLGLQVKPIKLEEKPKINKFKSSLSENNIKTNNSSKGLKQKLVNKVKSWNSRDKCFTTSSSHQLNVETELADSMKKLSHNSNSIDEVCNSNLVRARDSLENLIKNEDTMPRDENSSRLSTTSLSPEPGSPKSSPTLSDNCKPSTSSCKSFSWDPFDKQNRKNRKERKKANKKIEKPKNESKSILNGVGKTTKTNVEDKAKEEAEDSCSDYMYKYQYFPKNSKSVVFTNEVMVVYFNGDDVICECSEPLKKEVEQQVRNKEMRRGHLLKAEEKYNLCLF